MSAHLTRRRCGLLFAGALLVSGSAFGANEDDVKAVFDRFVSAQNAHDVATVRNLLLDSPSFLWTTRGSPIWGREAVPEAPILMNQTLVKTASGWRVASILPIPLPPANPVPAK